MRRRFLLAYLVCIHLLLVGVLITSDFLPRVVRRLGLPWSTQSELTPFYRRMLEHHKRMDNRVPDGAVLFIGDSIVQGLYVEAVASPAANYGIGGDTTVGVLRRLPGYASLHRAGAAVIAVGVNDFGRRGNDAIVQNWAAILDALPPRLPVIVSAVLPVDEHASQAMRGWNSRIRALNTSLQSLCRTRTDHCLYVDAGQSLADPEGGLSARYHEGDGLHLNAAGYDVWIRELKTAVQRSLSGK
jgi:lysophospholipase L1-like esterase